MGKHKRCPQCDASQQILMSPGTHYTKILSVEGAAGAVILQHKLDAASGH